MKLEPPWSDEEIAAVNFVFDNPDYGKRRSQQILEALTPFIAARMDAIRRESPWRPIKTAPKDGTQILCAEYHATWQDTDNGPWRFTPRRWRKYVIHEGFGLGEPTLWTDLPSPSQTPEETFTESN
jgi:hypothetical protein